MVLTLVNSETIFLRVVSTNVEIPLEPGSWIVQRIPNPKGHSARWIKLILIPDEGEIIGCAEKALLGNYPDTVCIFQ